MQLAKSRAPHGFVGNLEVASEGSQTFEVLGGADGRPLGRCPLAHPRDVDKAVAAARRAARRPPPKAERARLLEQLARAVERASEDLCIQTCLETGRSYRDVLGEDIEPAVRTLRYAAALTQTQRGSALDLGGGVRARVEPVPARVHASVLPVAEALGAALRKLAFATALGQSLVLLAPREAPLGVLELANLFKDAGGRAGAFNVLFGGKEAFTPLLAHPDVDLSSFAGPREEARRVLVGVAKSTLRPVQLELASPAVAVLLEEGDVEVAVDEVWRSGLASSSQLDRSVRRFLVHRDRFTEACDRLTRRARATVLGHPLDEHTDLGPLASEARMKRVLAYVELGRREGATLVAGGGRDVEGSRFDGWYVRPTLFLDPPPEARIAREPIEGPVVTLEPFSDEDELVKRAATSWGRGAALICGSSDRALELGERLDVGQVFVNGPLKRHPSLPHADAGELSAPLLGVEGLHALTEPRTLVVYPEEPKLR